MYHPTTDSWSCAPSDLPGNFQFPGGKIEDDITVTYPTDFVLNRGEAKPFTISYYIDNASWRAVGTAKVTYTLKWE